MGQAGIEGEEVMNILCRIGIHRWKPVYRFFPYVSAMPMYGFYLPDRFVQVARKCCQCGKRKPY